MTAAPPPRTRPARRPRRPRRRVLGRPHPARLGELPHHRHADLRLPAPDRRARRGQGGRRPRQRGARPARPARRPTPSSPPAGRSATATLHDQFVVDVIQGGAGTSTNMNANEVIANRALELLGHAKGDYGHLHPNEDVNLSQSTNDVYPTAVNVATVIAVRELLEAMAVLAGGVRRQGRRVPRRPQDGPHPAAGRGADDARPGVLRLRRDAGRGPEPTGRGRRC